MNGRTSWYWYVHEPPIYFTCKLWLHLSSLKYLSGLSKSPIRMGVFHPRNWLRQGTSHPLALSSQTQIHQMIKIFFSWLIPIFYKNYWSSKVPNPSINKIQVELVWFVMLCHVASLFTFHLLPNLSRILLAFSNSQIRPLIFSINSLIINGSHIYSIPSRLQEFITRY